MPSVMDLRLLRLFALLLIPISCWQIWIFPFMSSYYGQHVVTYPCVFFALWAWWRGLWNMHDVWHVTRPALPWIGLVLVLQCGAEWESMRRFAPDRGLWPICVNLFKWLAQLPIFLIFILICQVLLREARARRFLLQGALLSFVLLVVLCLVQGICVYARAYPFLADVGLEEFCQRVLLVVSPWLESRWQDAVPDFYGAGSYTLTENRMNGFFEEASSLAAMVAVFFAPLALGLMALGERLCHRAWLLAGMAGILSCLAMLMLCRSTSGQILAGVVLVLFLAVALRGRYRAFKLMVGGLMLAGCVYAALALPQVASYLVDRVDTEELHTSPRVITLKDTLDIIGDNPLLGVGRGWYFEHLHEGQRYLQNLHNEELRAWKEQGHGGALWEIPVLTAQYGLPLMLGGLFFVLRTVCLLWRRSRQEPENRTVMFAAHMAWAWLGLGLVASLAAFDVRNALFILPFCCFFVLAYGLDKPKAQKAPLGTA